jgi:hypothetical protein
MAIRCPRHRCRHCPWGIASYCRPQTEAVCALQRSIPWCSPAVLETPARSPRPQLVWLECRGSPCRRTVAQRQPATEFRRSDRRRRHHRGTSRQAVAGSSGRGRGFPVRPGGSLDTSERLRFWKGTHRAWLRTGCGAELNISSNVPRLFNRAFVSTNPPQSRSRRGRDGDDSAATAGPP